ncbi:MAG: ORF6N domain-containing protein [Candidatus Omnitrophica bacterium]|nr:ORF6N domain-containing protein [Candidatus Omnitrophota bacterium]
MKNLIPDGAITQKIFMLRGYKIMLSYHLAQLYGVAPKVLIQAVKRNIERFPEDFMFQLTYAELKELKATLQDGALRSQIVTLKRGQHMKYPPYAFTEQGVAMLSSVLRSKRAMQTNVAIMRAFVKLRVMISTHKELAQKLADLENTVGRHSAAIKNIFNTIHRLMAVPQESKRVITGFSKK